MKFLLDTDTCIYIIKRKPESVLKRFESLVPGDVGISSVTLAELQYGVEKSLSRARNQAALEEFLIPLDVADYNAEAALYYGKIRSDLERRGKPIGGNDLFIASHAMALSLPLVTNNVREFGRVHGLKVETWT